jgi:cell division transport system ATP-binding protein
MISVRRVTKVYPNGVTALREVDLEIAKGEFVFLVGASGAGKTTLLRLLFREETPTSGSVIVNGHDVGRMRPRQIPYLRRQIGVVFQDFRLLPQRNIQENIAFALRVIEVHPREIRRRVNQVLELVGLSDRGLALPAQLSGGEQQRIALARAMVSRPVMLLADEPTGNLDPQNAEEMMRIMLEINRLGTTVVMATHAAHLVDRARQRVVAMADGSIQRDELAAAYHMEVNR